MDSIFITGAASGIGAATAELFAARGWHVGLADRDEVGLRATRARIPSPDASTHVVDVTDSVSIEQALADFTARTGGRLRVLHNNAGLLAIGSFEELPIAEHVRIVDVNVTGAIRVLHAAFPYLRGTPGAQVVNMSSASAVYGTPDFASYSASKHAMRALTEALAIEWATHGIDVTDLMPPFVDTPMLTSQRRASKLVRRLRVTLGPKDVAAEVLRLVESPTLHRPLTREMQLLWPLARVLPARVTGAVMKALAGR